ncbi:MAG TPA: hypothetical protein PKC88_05355 [Plasticicumulans sp.]|nr:hypothetical protein [Plasticicumulans sp.]
MGANEKIPDSMVRAIFFEGIEITSRYNKLQELRLMSKAIYMLPRYITGMTKSFWCDSKCGSCYVVEFSKRGLLSDGIFFHRVGYCINAFHYAICKTAGGHNGIHAKHGNEFICDIEPWWNDDCGLI